jgi:hypothetical protein
VATMSDHILSSPQRLARDICAEIMATEDEIAEAIAAAVAYEREACAAIADQHVKEHEDSAKAGYPPGVRDAVQLEGRCIAAAIRVRKG